MTIAGDLFRSNARTRRAATGACAARMADTVSGNAMDSLILAIPTKSLRSARTAISTATRGLSRSAVINNQTPAPLRRTKENEDEGTTHCDGSRT